MLFVLEPITGVLATQLASFISPVCALAMLFIHGPHTFVFVTFGVELDAETFLAIVAPVTNVSGRAFPHLALNGAILLLWLLFDPIDRPVWTVLLGLGIGHLPVVNEWWPLLDDYWAATALTIKVLLLTVYTCVLLNKVKSEWLDIWIKTLVIDGKQLVWKPLPPDNSKSITYFWFHLSQITCIFSII